MVKVFPAGAFGPSYIREIKGPFADIELLACGGVNADNLGDYFAAGASAVAFGASVFRGEWFSAREYAQIGAEIEKLIGALRTWQARSG
jgi:2-dehydro-3-deoxyphosphogluconate aldolase/(4S)-4-hydroxy-2-oxoglutarate aldolase